MVTNQEILGSQKLKGMDQVWQRMNMTTLSSYLGGETIQGIWDHDGEEVLLERPAAYLRFEQIEVCAAP